jgi:hypothetical protein
MKVQLIHNYFAFVERRKANLTKVPIQTTQHEKQPWKTHEWHIEEFHDWVVIPINVRCH